MRQVFFKPEEWHLESACVDVDPEIFFLPDRIRGVEKLRYEARAKAICADCTVREQCLQYSLEREEPFGVWGGLSEDERFRLLKKTSNGFRRVK